VCLRGVTLLRCVQPGSGAHPGLVSTVLTRPVREADYAPLSRAELDISGAVPPLLHTSSWRGTRGQLYLSI
jgi:hypothetical protein